MNETQLCERLGITAEDLAGWLADGLPYEGDEYLRRFDAAAVRAWLVERGLVDGGEPDIILATQREVAEFWGTTHDTVARGWRTRGMPGIEGRYSVREISRWLAQRYAQGSGAESDTLHARRVAETRKIEADAKLRELKLKMEQGQYCSIERVRLLFAEIAGRSRDTLMRLPSELLPVLPREHATMIAKEVDTKVRGVLEMLCKRLCEIEEESRVDGDGNLTEETA